MRLVDELLEQLARRPLFGQIVLDRFDAVLVEEGDRLPARRSARLEIDLDALRHLFRTHHAAGVCSPETAGGRGTAARTGASSSSIAWTSGVQLPPQWPVVAPVRAAIWVIVHAPSRIALSIVRYLMLLQRQTVFRPRIAGCNGSSSKSGIRSEANTTCKRALPGAGSGGCVESPALARAVATAVPRFVVARLVTAFAADVLDVLALAAADPQRIGMRILVADVAHGMIRLAVAAAMTERIGRVRVRQRSNLSRLRPSDSRIRTWRGTRRRGAEGEFQPGKGARKGERGSRAARFRDVRFAHAKW